MTKQPAWIRTLDLFLLRIFFRKISVVGIERVPTEGPVIFVANHVNSIIDPMILAGLLPRTIRFLAKAPLFRQPIMGRILRAARALPVYRRMDPGSDMSRNEETFKACVHALQDGDAMALFPEGISHDEPQLQRLKTGAARIAGRAMSLGAAVQIVPVGLVYEDKTAFRSTVTAVVGPPIPTEGIVFREGEEEGPVRELTARVDEGLHHVTINADTFEDIELMEGLWEMARESLGLEAEPGARVRALRGFLERYYRARKDHPTLLHALAVRARAYRRALRSAGVTDRDVRMKRSTGPALRFTLKRLAFILGTYPPAFLGGVFHFVPYTLTGPVAKLMTRRPDTLGLNKLAVGVLFFPLFYFLQGWALFQVGGPWLCVPALILAPFAGFWALRYYEVREDFLATAWAFLLLLTRRGLGRRLREMRRDVLDALEPLSGLYR